MKQNKRYLDFCDYYNFINLNEVSHLQTNLPTKRWGKSWTINSIIPNENSVSLKLNRFTDKDEIEVPLYRCENIWDDCFRTTFVAARDSGEMYDHKSIIRMCSDFIIFDDEYMKKIKDMGFEYGGNICMGINKDNLTHYIFQYDERVAVCVFANKDSVIGYIQN